MPEAVALEQDVETAAKAAEHTREAIELQDVAVSLANRQVLYDINLRVSRGEFIALLGPNGAGKTTMLRSILGLVPATGAIVVDGMAPTKARKQLGYVPQRHAIDWNMPLSVEDVVVSGLTGRNGLLRRPSRSDYEAVFSAIRRVYLEDLRERPIAELSGGQRQRVLVARALALKPNILLLDEPFTGVDIPTAELLLDLFQTLAGESVAIVMSTHDLASAVHTASRICLVNRTIIADGPPSEVRSVELWKRAFGFRDESPLLAGIGLV